MLHDVMPGFSMLMSTEWFNIIIKWKVDYKVKLFSCKEKASLSQCINNASLHYILHTSCGIHVDMLTDKETVLSMGSFAFWHIILLQNILKLFKTHLIRF